MLLVSPDHNIHQYSPASRKSIKLYPIMSYITFKTRVKLNIFNCQKISNMQELLNNFKRELFLTLSLRFVSKLIFSLLCSLFKDLPHPPPVRSISRSELHQKFLTAKVSSSTSSQINLSVCLFVCLSVSTFEILLLKGSSSQSEHSLRLTNQSEDSILSALSADISCSIKTQ